MAGFSWWEVWGPLNPALGPLRPLSSSTTPPSNSAIAGAAGSLRPNGISIDSAVKAGCTNAANYKQSTVGTSTAILCECVTYIACRAEPWSSRVLRRWTRDTPPHHSRPTWHCWQSADKPSSTRVSHPPLHPPALQSPRTPSPAGACSRRTARDSS